MMFCGWDFLKKIQQGCRDDIERSLIATLFETGGRPSEIVLLSNKNFIFKDQFIIVENMPLKRGRTMSYRTFPIPRNEPLVEEMLLAFRISEQPFNFTPTNLYIKVKNIVIRLGEMKIPFSNEPVLKISPKWFREMRIAQLYEEYEFDLADLAAFFGWRLPWYGGRKLPSFWELALKMVKKK
ncbi:MAG: hypothetical protein QXP04_04230 [Candidatus Nanoarchaeia archaeon]|nr:hypothetical protein [Candidatus Jingweiarchaeum tengchongense]